MKKAKTVKNDVKETPKSHICLNSEKGRTTKKQYNPLVQIEQGTREKLEKLYSTFNKELCDIVGESMSFCDY